MSIFSSIGTVSSYVIDAAVEICGCSSPQKSSDTTRYNDAGDRRNIIDPIIINKVESWLNKTEDPREKAPR